MENFPSDHWDVTSLVKELTQGRELARQLQAHLNVVQSSSNSQETRDFLLRKILNSYDQALSIIRPRAEAATPAMVPVVAASDSPRSLTGSPRTDDSDQDFKDIHHSSRKRKGMESWTQRVEVCAGRGVEGQLDDGYGWRKYGQKDILGAKYPRGYYRCTHRHSQGCLATKQVQRSGDDPTIFEITYRGKHICNAGANPSINHPPMHDPQDEIDENPNSNTQNAHQPVENQPEPSFNIQTSLRVITHGHNLEASASPSFEPFKFPSSSTISPENNNQLFPNSSHLIGNYSSNLMSPATSESDYFTISRNVFNNNYERSIHDLHISESDELSLVVATTTSVANSPTLGAHFPFGSSGFNPNSSFGYPDYFP